MAFNILIVDDCPSMRKVIRRVLALSGFETGACLEASDGVEALSLLETEPVDIVLADINMPNMNGEQLVEIIAAHPKHRLLPVLVISTDRSEDRLTRVLALGARGYVTKPFIPQDLASAMNKVVGGDDAGRRV